MEYVRQVVESSVLLGVISLPVSFQNRKVEIIVRPVIENKIKPVINDKMLDEMMEGSITQSLIGSVPDSGASLDEIRAERLRRYESVD